MTVRLKIDGIAGKAAIYTGSDDAPFDAPLSHVGRTLFHSDLPAVHVLSAHTGNIGLVEMVGNSTNSQKHVLFAHGRAGTPYVEGKITSNNGDGQTYSLTGSVPVDKGLGSARILHLGADTTNVYIREMSSCPVGWHYAPITISYEVYLTSVLLT